MRKAMVMAAYGEASEKIVSEYLANGFCVTAEGSGTDERENFKAKGRYSKYMKSLGAHVVGRENGRDYYAYG